jgi:hypothetical protein
MIFESVVSTLPALALGKRPLSSQAGQSLLISKAGWCCCFDLTLGVLAPKVCSSANQYCSARYCLSSMIFESVVITLPALALGK